jgi:hypothetical protein
MTLASMATPAKASAGAKPGTALPEREDGEQPDRLRVIPDGELSPELINRISLDELEERRLRANGR